MRIAYLTIVMASAVVVGCSSEVSLRGGDAAIKLSDSTLNAVAISGSEVDLTWSEASLSDKTASAALQYEVRQSTTVSLAAAESFEGSGIVIRPAQKGLTSAKITGLLPATTYHFNVAVYDEKGRSALYKGASVTTNADAEAPKVGASGVVSASAVTYNSATIRWSNATDSSSSSNDISYEVRLSSSSIATLAAAESSGSIAMAYTKAVTSVDLTGLVPGQTYYVNVLAKDPDGNRVAYNGTTFTMLSDTQAPVISGTPVVAPVTSSSATLTWAAATDNLTSASSMRYEVWFATTAFNSLSQTLATGTLGCSATGGSLSCTVTAVTPSETMYFAVLAKDEAGIYAMYPSVSAVIPDIKITTVGAKPAMGDSAQQRSFYDSTTGKTWMFYNDGTQIQIKSSTSIQSWQNAGSVALNADKFSVTQRRVGSTLYVALVAQYNRDILIRRGVVGASSITFDNEITVFDGSSVTDHYVEATAAFDASDRLWIAAIYRTSPTQLYSHAVKVTRSVNSIAGDLTAWGSGQTFGGSLLPVTGLNIVNRTGDQMFLVMNHDYLEAYAFDGSTWAAANQGGKPVSKTHAMGQDCRQLIAVGTRLYVFRPARTAQECSPYFDMDQTPALTEWNGSEWVALGSGISGTVIHASAGLDGNLYVLGNFVINGQPGMMSVASFDGSSWTQVATVGPIVFSGLGNYSWPITSLIAARSSTEVYVSYYFGISNPGGVFKWNGSAWSYLTPVTPNTMAVTSDGRLYIAGGFASVNGLTANRVAYYNGSTWNTLGSGVTGSWADVTACGSEVYAYSSSVTNVGGVAVNTVGKWNGSSWSNIGSGLTLRSTLGDIYPRVFCNSAGTRVLLTDSTSPDGDNQYIGFSAVNGVSITGRMAWFNGTTWQDINSGKKDRAPTSAAVTSNGDLYYLSGGGIYRWDGSAETLIDSKPVVQMTSYSSLGSTFAVASNGDIYVIGQFQNIGGVLASNIARYDGTNFYPLGAGLNGVAKGITIDTNGDVYVVGYFTRAGGNSVYYVAKWNGSTWSGMPGVINLTGYAAPNLVQNLGGIGMLSPGNVVITGSFWHVNGVLSNGVARWNGTTWTGYTGLSILPNKLAVVGSDLYTYSSPNLMKWNGSWQTEVGSFFQWRFYGLGTALYAMGYNVSTTTYVMRKYLGGSSWGTGVTIPERCYDCGSVAGGSLYTVKQNSDSTISIGTLSDDTFTSVFSVLPEFLKPAAFATNGTSLLAYTHLNTMTSYHPEELKSFRSSNSGVANLPHHRVQTLVNPQTGTIHVLAYDPNSIGTTNHMDIQTSYVTYLRYENGQWSTPKTITRSPFAVMTLDTATDTPSVHGVQLGTTMYSFQRQSDGSWSQSAPKLGLTHLYPARGFLSEAVDREPVNGKWNLYIHDRLSGDNSLIVRSLP